MSAAAILTEFKECGLEASHHYADDSTKEWKLADAMLARCYQLWRAHPELQDDMREISRSFMFAMPAKEIQVRDAYEECEHLSRHCDIASDTLAVAP